LLVRRHFANRLTTSRLLTSLFYFVPRGWSKRSSEGRDYLSVKLDDPSFNAPIADLRQPLR